MALKVSQRATTTILGTLQVHMHVFFASCVAALLACNLYCKARAEKNVHSLSTFLCSYKLINSCMWSKLPSIPTF